MKCINFEHKFQINENGAKADKTFSPLIFNRHSQIIDIWSIILEPNVKRLFDLYTLIFMKNNQAGLKPYAPLRIRGAKNGQKLMEYV